MLAVASFDPGARLQYRLPARKAATSTSPVGNLEGEGGGDSITCQIGVPYEPVAPRELDLLADWIERFAQ